MAYEDDRFTSEAQRQSDKKGSTSQSVHTTADIAHFTRLLAAEMKWGVQNGALAALRSLGKFPSEIAVPANTSGVAGFSPS
jgi:hypothetical protein